MRLLDDSWPCAPEDSANALLTLSRCPFVAEWGYQATTQRLWWSLWPSAAGDAACQHLAIKQRVQRSISLHSALGWE